MFVGAMVAQFEVRKATVTQGEDRVMSLA